MSKPRPILIAGPTASGKSGLALEIAQHLDGAIINADALQVYGLWRVLTARPSKADEALSPHLLYGHVDPSESYSVGAWLRDLEKTLAEVNTTGQTPIIVGGTGLYLTALTEGLAEIPPIPEEIRAKGDEMRAQGADAFAALETRDPAIWARIDRNNPARLQRAWEVLEATGRPLSDWQANPTNPLLPLGTTAPIVMDAGPDWLGARIETRFDQMLEEGALDECKEWLAQDLSMDLPAAKALGAAEIIAYLSGEMTLDEARDRATIATRQFAKRQRTWFRSRMKDWNRLDIAQLGRIAAADKVIAMLGE